MTAILKVDTIQDTSGNNIINESSNTITIGASGDTISIPSGATITGSGLGRILQVVSTTKTDVFTATGGDTWHDVTGLTATITPSSTSSKILVTGHVMGSSQNAGAARRFFVLLLRGTTVVGQGDASSNRLRVHNSSFSDNGANNATIPINFLDTPSSTSALTYKIQVRDDTDGVRVNAAPGDSDSDTYPRAVSTITVMEVAG